MTPLNPGEKLPEVTLSLIGGGKIAPGQAVGEWQMLVVYRGRHCPRCKTYFKKLQGLLADFEKLGLSVVAASADPQEKAEADVAEEGWTFPVAYDLSIPQMQALGLYISDPASPNETDRPFAEPGLFVVNDQGKLHVLGISNSASCRPDLDIVLDGIKGIQTRGLPIRGTRV